MFHSITGFCVVDGDMARQIEGLIHENVVDPSLREWIMPKFTTTTPNDLIISSIITLSSLQESFSYRRKKGRHGLPAVTLLRKKGDWEKMLDKTEKLKEYGEETTQWYGLLKPILTGFVDTFNHPKDIRREYFSMRIASYTRVGCRPSFVTGWITTSCFLGASGKPLHRLSSAFSGGEPALYDVCHRELYTQRIPSTYAKVPVKLNDKDVERNG